ncbi:MAG: helix-turn-helix transcriptional regulator [Planctomycetes bacterium]|nr:helix-turn-helix transcriptional regulator [Planctomycetota bacterium]
MVHDDQQDQATRATSDANPIPVSSMVESIVGCKWSVGLLRLLAEGCCRPSAILRASTGLSAKVMNERLRKMLRFGIVSRTVFGDKPPLEVEYVLTPFGRRFMGIIEEVRRLQEAVDRGAVSENAAIRKQAGPRGRLTSR